MSKETNIKELQQLEQAILSSSNQIRSLRAKIIEIDSALKDLESSETAYKIVGNIMISSSKEDVIKGLESEREIAETRIASLEKQEKKLYESFKEKQKLLIINIEEKEHSEKKERV